MQRRLDSPESSVESLLHENQKLTKIVGVLMARVERSTDAQGGAFSLFQAAITLESTVRQRTVELQSLNRQLSFEVEERRTVERELQIAKADAERANLAKTEFLAAASHDLMQPLNVARLFIDAIADEPLEEERTKMLERVGQSLGSAQTLLTTLLEMSRLDAGALRADMRDVALDPLLRQMSSEYGFAADEHGLRLRVIPTDAIVHTDIGLLERVLRNLLSNALRYTDRGGVLVGTRRRGGRLHLEIWDTGRGIPAESLREIFVEFRRLATSSHDGDRSPGMGLGLAVVDRIAPLIGATVEVRSREGRGSVFSIGVPLATGTPTLVQTPAAGVERGADGFEGRTVLVVDADPATLDHVRTILQRLGIETVAARCIDSAASVWSGRRDLPAAILADYRLEQGATGFDAIDAVRASFGGARVPAIITGELGESTRRRAAERGFGYLQKPVRVERLRSLLAHLLPAK